MPEIWNHFPLEQMIICSFISREALKISAFSENPFGLKKKKTKQTPNPQCLRWRVTAYTPEAPEKCAWRFTSLP